MYVLPFIFLPSFPFTIFLPLGHSLLVAGLLLVDTFPSLPGHHWYCSLLHQSLRTKILAPRVQRIVTWFNMK